MSYQGNNNSDLGEGFRGFGGDQMLYFPNDTVKFKQIKRVGTISPWTRVYFGELKTVRRDPNRVIFEFQDGRVKFDGWSVSHNMEENMAILKVGNRYILTGDMRVQHVSEKYDRTTNATFTYRVFLGKVTVVTEERVEGFINPIYPTSFSDLRGTLRGSSGFTIELRNVTIIAGDAYRYMGCEKCTKSIRAPDFDGNYYCQQCKKIDGPKKRKACVIYRDVVLRDQRGEIIMGVVIFENELRTLIGERGLNELHSYPFDINSLIPYMGLIGRKIDALLKRARPRNSDEYPPSMVLRNVTPLPVEEDATALMFDDLI